MRADADAASVLANIEAYLQSHGQTYVESELAYAVTHSTKNGGFPTYGDLESFLWILDLYSDLAHIDTIGYSFGVFNCQPSSIKGKFRCRIVS